MNRVELGKFLKEIRESKSITKYSIYNNTSDITKAQMDRVEDGGSNYTIDCFFTYLNKIGLINDFEEFFKSRCK